MNNIFAGSMNVPAHATIHQHPGDTAVVRRILSENESQEGTVRREKRGCMGLALRLTVAVDVLGSLGQL